MYFNMSATLQRDLRCRVGPDSFLAATSSVPNETQALLKKVPAKNIVVAGGSAGAHLTAALLLRLANDKLPLPAAAVLFSPWALLVSFGLGLSTTHLAYMAADPCSACAVFSSLDVPPASC